MTMPETAMDEYRLQATRKNNVGLASQLPHMKSIAIAVRPQPFANKQLRFCVLASDPGHIVATRFAGRGAQSFHNYSNW